MNADSKKSRLLFLDNIKVLFSILVIFQHARVTYGGTGWWYYIESIPVDDFSVIFFTTLSSIGGLFQASLMGLFFLLGGYFTPKSYDRKGVGSFWKERILRLGIPILLYIGIISPLMAYSLAALGIYPWPLPASLLGFLTFWGPMWFLVVLLLFTACYTLWRQITKIKTIQNRIPNEFGIPKYIYLLLFAVGLGFITFLIRIVYSIDQGLLGLPISFIILYFMMFSVGVVAFRYEWIEKMTKKHVKVWAIVIAVSFILFFAYAALVVGLDADLSVFMGGFNLHALFFAIVESVICMGMIFVLIKIFYAKLNKQGKILQNLSSSAFYIYLIHPPVLVLISLGFANLSFVPAVKFLIVFPLTVIVCYLLSHYFLEKIHLKRRKQINQSG
ncbi:MAG: acyltransferase family protein [Candidatus Lokiarchaeia archaeon]|nr:acyltransferase family protein [Candidatus Lokiarchaeia archaeon]